MNKEELVSYIQGLLDLNKATEELYGPINVEFDSSIETKLLKLINEALTKHKGYLNKNDVSYFNKKADEYSTPLSAKASKSFKKDDIDKGFIKHKQITKRP